MTSGGTLFLESGDDALEIGIAGTEAAREPVPATLGDFFTVGEDVELALLSGCGHGFHTQAFLDEGHETRDLGLVVVSRRAVDDLDLHASSELVMAAATW